MPSKDRVATLKSQRERYAKNKEPLLAAQRAKWKNDTEYRNTKKAAHVKWAAENPEKVLAYNRKYYEKNGDQQRLRCRETAARQLREKHNLTEEEHARLLTNGCGICRAKATAVDHCHRTGKVRGGLCHKCNIGIGYFNDCALLLNNAIDYLKRHNT